MVDKDVAPSGEKNGSDSNNSQSFSDQEREWARLASIEFNHGNYSACLQNLVKLEASCGQDVKLGHNKAVAEYFKSELRKTDQFKKSLNTLCSQAHLNLDDVSALEDVDKCIFYFNHSVLLFHRKQYATALHILSKVFAFIEPMEESLAQKVSMLLLELLLRTHQPERALPQISYIEQQFISTFSVTGSKLSAEKEVKGLEKIDKEKSIEPTDIASDPIKIRLFHYKLECLLKTHQLVAAKKELSLVSSLGNNMPTIFLKANYEYLRGNFRQAMRVLNSAPENILSFKDIGEHIPALYYNNMGCVHHYISKPNLSTFYFQKALVEEEEAMRTLLIDCDGANGQPLYTIGSNHNLEIKYNLGVALLHAGRPTQAFDLLVDVVRVFHMNPRLWLRLAECCIMVYKKSNSDDFNIAHRRQDMVQGVVGSGIHKKIILSPQLASEINTQEEEVSSAIPSTRLEFASLCLRNALSLLSEFTASVKNGSNVESSAASLRLGTPLSGLSGGLSIAGLSSLGGPGSNLVFGSGGVSKAPIQRTCYAAPSSPLSETEVESLRCSVLVNSAYVCLCLGDYIMALKHAQELLKQPKLSGAQKLLGHLYAAEAFLMCNKISDAIDHLNPENIKDVNLAFPSQTPLEKERISDSDKEVDAQFETKRVLQAWCPKKTGTARAVLQYNLAVAFSTRGELDKAGETLKRVFSARGPDCEVPIHIVMLALYLELQLGHSEVSRNIVRQHCPQFK